MKITSIETIKVFVPWRDSFKEPMQAWRAYNNNSTVEEEDAYVLIEMHTDEGLVGLGEGGRDLDEIRRQAQRFLGKNPLELNPWALDAPFTHAVYDILGKAHGVPAYRLFGEKYRDAIPVAYWSPYTSVKQAAQFAEEGRSRGFRVHKIKGRADNAAETIIAMCKAAGPDYAIRIDPNETFAQPAVALRIDDAVSNYNIECWEDPVPKARLEWYELLRAKCKAALCLHTSDPQLILEALRRNAADYFNIGQSAETSIKSSALCAAGGCPVWLQIEGHCLDICAAFIAHLGAAIPNASLPYDVLPFLRERSIVANPPEVREGLMRVPEGPGLGIELDRGAVKRYHVA
jgi:L-alanine-DL-glutamate epimerase-like enolase superfamily enzyme